LGEVGDPEERRRAAHHVVKNAAKPQSAGTALRLWRLRGAIPVPLCVLCAIA
jgi:hypothetical protein